MPIDENSMDGSRIRQRIHKMFSIGLGHPVVPPYSPCVPSGKTEAVSIAFDVCTVSQ